MPSVIALPPWTADPGNVTKQPLVCVCERERERERERDRVIERGNVCACSAHTCMCEHAYARACMLPMEAGMCDLTPSVTSHTTLSQIPHPLLSLLARAFLLLGSQEVRRRGKGKHF